MGMRAALYLRVSTEDQAREGFSLDAQRRRLSAYCKARGWEVAAVYVDEGHSGRDVRRPAYRRMMEESGSWDLILVLKMDRIHRNSVNFTLMMDALRGWGKEFNSVQESFDTTTAMGRFVMDIMQRIAQLESEQIGERVRMGMEHKARSGKGILGFGHPYGYDVTDDGLTVNEHEARVVREMYRMRAEGSSLQAIADRMNSLGIRSKKGLDWSRQSVHRILKNPLYCGYVRWADVLRQGEHAAIISQEEFSGLRGNDPPVIEKGSA